MHIFLNQGKSKNNKFINYKSTLLNLVHMETYDFKKRKECYFFPN